jgi:poly-gamma-glutamate system protein
MVLQRKKTFPRKDSRNLWGVFFLFFLSLFFFILIKTVLPKKVEAQKNEMVHASEIMEEALASIKGCFSGFGFEMDPDVDVNATGLIGLEFSPITTSVGNLGSKRTTINPNIAALVAFLLRKAGVRGGDAVAVGASGSFPALILAVLAASKAMNIDPVIICSLGASQWGANRPEFHFLDMLGCLWSKGVFDYVPIAMTLGGDKDVGESMDEETRALLVADIENSGIPFLLESDLQTNVRKKMQAYEIEAGDRGLKCFINIGGNWSNIGEDSEILNLKPGLVKIRRIPSIVNRGLVFAMADRDIPVLHLLYIKGLVERYGLPWDPIPLPEPGEGEVYRRIGEGHHLFKILGSLYLLGVVLVIAGWKIISSRK